MFQSYFLNAPIVGPLTPSPPNVLFCLKACCTVDDLGLVTTTVDQVPNMLMFCTESLFLIT